MFVMQGRAGPQYQSDSLLQMPCGILQHIWCLSSLCGSQHCQPRCHVLHSPVCVPFCRGVSSDRAGSLHKAKQAPK
jgi:hypothetical protein